MKDNQASLLEIQAQIEEIQEQLAALETDGTAEIVLRTLREKIADLESKQLSDGTRVSGDVDTDGGDFVGRDKTITIYQGRYEGDSPRTAAQKRHIYCEYIAQQAGALPLRGMDRAESDTRTQRHPLSLSGVYTNLDTTLTLPDDDVQEMLASGIWQSGMGDAVSTQQLKVTRDPDDKEEKETRPLAALEATAISRKLVLLGDPGSGKTTFVNYLTQAFAQRNFKNLDVWPQSERNLLPIVVVLRDFYRWTQSQGKKWAPNANLMWKFILHDLESKNLAFAEIILDRALEDGQALILLDGLDEVPPGDARMLVRDCVLAFHARYVKNRFLITCRVLSYQEPKWQLPKNDFLSFELASFDDEKITQFIQAWYNEVAQKWRVPPDRTHALADKLLNAIKRPDLARLAPNPLLLTVMALVHTEYGELPDNRAQLYQQAVDVLLWRWEQEKNKEYGGQSQMVFLLQQAERDRNDLLDVLSRLAFNAHQHGGDTKDPEAVSGISQMDLLTALRELHPERSLDWAEKVVEAMRLRAGLLLDRDGKVFTFPHRTFQEYLAGTHLALRPDFPTKASQFVNQGDFWRVVILLAVGHLAHNNRNRAMPLMLVNELCPQQTEDNETAWQRALLAGEALLELGINRVQDSETGKSALKRVRTRLTDLIEQGLWAAPQRAEAGDVLGKLGDLRFDPQIFYLPARYQNQPEDAFGFVRIPAGSFLMGSKEGDEDAWDNEHPQHKVPIPYDYWIARYPVTVAQFRAFVQASGYDFNRWRNNPIANRPVVRVTWYDARAYCAWLTEQLSQIRDTQALPWPKEYIVRLPTEAEWEKAARSDDARRYPWSDGDWNPELANISASNFGHPTSVGIYPQGISTCGALDMSGNVLEWTRSVKKDYPYDAQDGREDLDASGSRVVRGGSWIGDLGLARCAFRDWFDPRLRGSSRGFRVVVSLADSGS
ncbi:MAG: SUMF1/EgtB/PvdO family nonheme iron enzyme [Chloroflexota bacterium]|nr:SUMF1/EgtB/PvdO family nonheme iron enzyme [Chloroflexota bacterium]